jgi:hypothetical protein
MDGLSDRIGESRAALGRLRPAIEAGEPWPLSVAYGAEPEADWGPKEVLAHVAEMAPYWLAQAESVLAAPLEPAEPPPFGRIATDPARIASIGRDRALPAGELLAAIDAGLADVLTRLAALSPAERARRGVHPRLGEMTAEAILERFVVGHLEEHVRQLEEILALRGIAGPDRAG